MMSQPVDFDLDTLTQQQRINYMNNELFSEVRTPREQLMRFLHDPVCLETLLTYKVIDVDEPDEFGNTILHEATSYPFEIFRMVLDASFNTNAQNDEGDTPLHLVARCPHDVEFINLLMGKYTDPSITNNAGETALEVSYQSGDKRAVDLLEFYDPV